MQNENQMSEWLCLLGNDASKYANSSSSRYLKMVFFTILVITEMIEQTYFNYQLLHALFGLEDTLEIESF